MDARELRFRVACEARKAAGRIRSSLKAPEWRRETLLNRLSGGSGDRPASFAAARTALDGRNWAGAHRALADHFALRTVRFPLDPRALDRLRDEVRQRFPEAVVAAGALADGILEGRGHFLGYENLDIGTPPRWHDDPVHRRRAPAGYWANVAYLDPAGGDHKVIWEINRHQHWLTLARAFHLSGDRKYYREFVVQLEDWLHANPPLHGVNWASMLELAFRCLSWLWALHFFADAARKDRDSDPPWLVDILLGLDLQLDHISQNLSAYFSPNTHLSGEALALYVAGLALPELAAGERRAATGREVLLKESSRQVGADGGHVELSTHYHRYSTDFYLLASLAARVTRDSAEPQLTDAARRQARYLRTITDDTGRMPIIGDDDGGQLFPICGREPADCRDSLAAASVVLEDPALAVSDIPEEVLWLCGSTVHPAQGISRQSEWPSAALESSGYYVSRTRRGDHLVFDAGRHGFLNGGHAHADALSIVLTVANRPLLIDPGTATYTMDPQIRDQFRSTAMHNTVVVNGRMQSEPRGPFHWRTRTDARSLAWRTVRRATGPASGGNLGQDFDYMEGCHDGYAPITHVRAVLAVHGVGWVIVDHLLGSGDATADAMWHLHPSWSPRPHKGGMLLEHRDGEVRVVASSEVLSIVADGARTLGMYAPVYGRIEPSPCLVASTAGRLPRSFATFFPAGAGSDPVSLAPVDCEEELPQEWHAAAFTLTSRQGDALILAAVERSPGARSTGAPPHRWGAAGATTNARAAFVNLRTPSASILIDGTKLDTSATSTAGPNRASRDADDVWNNRLL